MEEAEVMVKRFAQGLQKLGLRANDKALLYSNNNLFFPVLLWGVIAAQCVFTSASPAATVQELTYQLRDSEAKVLFTSPDTAHIALQAASEVGLPRGRVYLFNQPNTDPKTYASLNLRNWTDIWTSAEDAVSWSWKKISTLEEASSTTAIINYSSGTTGLPKGVEITHYNSVANSLQLTHKLSLVADTTEGRARQARLDTSGQRWLAALPMYHVFGQTWYCMNAVRLGVKVFIMPKYNIVDFLQLLDVYRITFLMLVPTIMTSINKQPYPSQHNLKALESVICGTAPWDLDTAKNFKKQYLRSDVQIKQVYGMTEITSSLLGFAPDDSNDGRSVGWLHANCTAKIVPLEEQDLSQTVPPEYTAGELWVAAPNVMKGYFKRPDETAKTIIHEDGQRWLRTGDIAYFDKEGLFYMVGRHKEFIKVKGIQVSPAELELTLSLDPRIADAAVAGAKINGEEHPRAFVVKEDPRLTEDDVSAIIKEKFSRYKWLTGGVFFVNQIPRTTSGKVQRRFLPNPEAAQKLESKL